MSGLATSLSEERYRSSRDGTHLGLGHSRSSVSVAMDSFRLQPLRLEAGSAVDFWKTLFMLHNFVSRAARSADALQPGASDPHGGLECRRGADGSDLDALLQDEEIGVISRW